MRAVLLLSALICAIGFLSETPQGKAALAPVLDRFDQRPVRRILIIGNSRTYYHDMPRMVRQIADGARSPVRFDITTLAWGGASFEENWTNAEVQRALSQHWDQIILQPESRAVSGDQNRQSFATYGEKLVAAGRSTNSPVALIINWAYAEQAYGSSADRRAHIEMLEESERILAGNGGAQIIDTSAVWEKVHAANPALPLYDDDNHPSIYGSYLSALMLEGFLAKGGVTETDFDPPATSKDSTAVIKNAVTDYYRS